MKKNKDLVSIIVPVYNASKFLNDTINTVLNQTYENWELIFVDDCSVDNSIDIISESMKNDKRIKLIKNNINKGPALSRNIGVEKAIGSFLCFLDADDLWDKDKLEKQINFMKKKECAFSYHSYEYANEFGIAKGKKVFAKKKMTYNKALKNTIISTITVMFDLTKIDKALIEMPNLIYVEDTATWWKILRNGYIAYGIPEIFSYYRRIKNSNSSNKLRTQKSLWNLYRKEEKLGFIRSFYYLSIKNFNALRRRIL